MSSESAATSVAELLDLFERFGDHRYDEELSQSSHALQCAALAVLHDASDALVAAALLHDVGHLLHLRDTGSVAHDDDRHETTGARYLSALFDRDVTRPIALHVTAKRYLCAVDDSYRTALSEGSTRSLARQGGPLAAAEVAAFEHAAGFADAVTLRRCDDHAKLHDVVIPPFGHYMPLLERLRRLLG